MSSLRNAVQRRNHKERAQPLERSKWGLLEKHKDYSLRAKDHNTKKRKIKALQQKASERNEDEFYFGMMSSSTKKGIKVAKRGEDNGGGKSLSMDVVKLMKTQDVAYLRTILQTTRKSADRLEEEVKLLNHGVPVERHTGKTVFDEDGQAVPREEPELADLSDEDGSEDEGTKASPPLAKKRTPAQQKQHTLEVKQRKLEVLRTRQKELTAAVRGVEAQRVRMRGKAGGVNKNGVKFRVRQRQG